MMALLWYYRPESLTPPRRNGVIDCELFASRHCDVNPVDCIEDRAYVLSASAYARFMAQAKYKQVSRVPAHFTFTPLKPPDNSSICEQLVASFLQMRLFTPFLDG